MLTVFTEGGEKAKKKNLSNKGKGKPKYGNRDNNRDKTSIGDKPNKGKGKGRQKGKGRDKAEVETDRTLRPVATAAFLDTMLETVGEDRMMRKRNKKNHQTNEAKKQETTFRFRS
jgi:hypothetical protein